MFYTLGQNLLLLSDHELSDLAQAAGSKNNWFTEVNVKSAIDSITKMLSQESLEAWTSSYQLSPATSKKVGLVMAGNIPLVGFHDLLSVLISGHHAVIKLSSQDDVLMRFVIDQLISIQPEMKESITIADQLKGVDAVIATGSDNSARYFKHYFGGIPNIIRQNRTSVGIINGKESDEELHAFGNDIFQYYGLGCRNVSKVFVPIDYDLTRLIEALSVFSTAIEHHKFRNNYDYNKSIYLVNKEPHLDSGFFLMKESKELVSPISVLFFEKYSTEAELSLRLSADHDKIQTIVSQNAWYEGSIRFGTAQCPKVEDYADGVDTLEFLESL